MSALEQVKTALKEAVESAGGRAVLAFPPEEAKRYDVPVVAVGLRTGESRGAALQSYLGLRTDPDTLLSREVYGMRLELTVSLDVYAPASLGAAGCDGALETLHTAVLRELPRGLAPGELKWEDAVWDGDTAMFLRKGSLQCAAFFTAERSEDGEAFTDFILKGAVKT